MRHRCRFGLHVLACLLCIRAAICVPQSQVIIRKVGFPVQRYQEKAVCGERLIEKSMWNAIDYLLHILFGGFREGTCAGIGYKNFEAKVNYSEHDFPLMPYHNVTIDVFSRDVGFIDVAGCIGRECWSEIKAMGTSNYLNDVAHCISPAFGPCVPKAWKCLGDSVCKSTLECLPSVAQVCGSEIFKMITNDVERDKLQCIVACNNSKICILEQCGKDAIECLTGVDKLCHDALTCVPSQLTTCSLPAFHCMFDRHSECRENIHCLVSGANACADPVLNFFTDRSIPQLMTCANTMCPAPMVHPNATEALASPELPAVHTSISQAMELAMPTWPAQLACMNSKCGLKVLDLLTDKDIQAVGTCLMPSAESCGDSVWDCLGDTACRSSLQCWVNGSLEESSYIWKMVTDPSERIFLDLLGHCFVSCASESNPVKKIGCMAKCGLKSATCILDKTCRRAFDELPFTVAKCGIHDIGNTKFWDAFKCAGEMAGDCGRAGIELIRDEKLATLLSCTHQCTREPVFDSMRTVDVIV